MKHLKIKFGLFSLLVILAVSVFLASCEQDVAQVETYNANEDSRLLLPKGISLDKDEFAVFIEQATDAELKKMRESYRVFDYLSSINKLSDLYENTEQGQYYSGTPVESFLTSDELLELKSYSPSDNIQNRSYNCTYLFEMYPASYIYSCCDPGNVHYCFYWVCCP